MRKVIFLGAAVLVVGSAAFYLNNVYSPRESSEEKVMNEGTQTEVKVTPIEHATLVFEMGGQVIYADPVGGADAFAGQPAPNIILITDIHGDHLNGPTIQAVSTQDTVIIAPQAVVDELPEGISGTVVTLINGEVADQKGLKIEAVPMYNLPGPNQNFHTKGRGNGYIVEANGQRVYLSGDSADIPEMRGLQNIDVAFVAMNLPYTMDVESAADAVLEFKPKTVHPYHYRGPEGLSDINKFKQLVNEGDSSINVDLLDFYPGE